MDDLLGFTNSDIILIVTAIILLLTLLAIKKGNEESARLNRLQATENTIIKQLEFHNNMLKGISIDIRLAGRGYGIPDAPNIANGQAAFEIFYDILKERYRQCRHSNHNFITPRLINRKRKLLFQLRSLWILLAPGLFILVCPLALNMPRALPLTAHWV